MSKQSTGRKSNYLLKLISGLISLKGWLNFFDENITPPRYREEIWTLLMDRRQINKTHLCSTGPKLISGLIRVVGAISQHNDNILNILIGYDDQARHIRRRKGWERQGWVNVGQLNDRCFSFVCFVKACINLESSQTNIKPGIFF